MRRILIFYLVFFFSVGGTVSLSLSLLPAATQPTYAHVLFSLTRHQLPNHDYPQARHLRQQEQGHRRLLCRRHRGHNRSLLDPSKHRYIFVVFFWEPGGAA